MENQPVSQERELFHERHAKALQQLEVVLAAALNTAVDAAVYEFLLKAVVEHFLPGTELPPTSLVASALFIAKNIPQSIMYYSRLNRDFPKTQE